MNSFIKSVILWAAVISAVPAAAAAGHARTEPFEDIPAAKRIILPAENELKLLYYSNGEITEISPEEYAVFAVLEEVPFIPDEEALKAQVCAARTYAVRRILSGEGENGAHISDDPAKYQTMLSEADAEAVYGDAYESAYAAVKAAAAATEGEIIMYDGAPAAAVFHISSAGCTESAEGLWGTAYPYLISVPSDCTESVKDFTPAELTARISAEYDSAEAYDGAEIISRSESGTVLSVRICGVELSGARLSELLTLDSGAFDISESDGKVNFTVKGCGSLVGMSICGADEMSRQGFTYKEILEHYYPGTETVNIM